MNHRPSLAGLLVATTLAFTASEPSRVFAQQTAPQQQTEPTRSLKGEPPQYQRGEDLAKFFSRLNIWMLEKQNNKARLNIAISEVARHGFDALQTYYADCAKEASPNLDLQGTNTAQNPVTPNANVFIHNQVAFIALTGYAQKFVDTVSLGLALSYDLKDVNNQPVTPNNSFLNVLVKNTIPTDSDVPTVAIHHNMFDQLKRVSTYLSGNIRKLSALGTGTKSTNIRMTEIRRLYHEFENNVITPLRRDVVDQYPHSPESPTPEQRPRPPLDLRRDLPRNAANGSLPNYMARAQR